MGSIGGNTPVETKGIFDRMMDEEDDYESNQTNEDNTTEEYTITLSIHGFRVVHHHMKDGSQIYYVYDRNNQLYGEAHSQSELTEFITELEKEEK